MYGSGEGNQESFGQLIASLLLSIFESNGKQTIIIDLFQENLKYVYSYIAIYAKRNTTLLKSKTLKA